ncbi:MAG: immunoglobulin domain-containing protein [Phycisphaerales bacterium]|nr:immunoglobulin domain-containing protein [Phycisphaerales bacterium]
MTPARSNGVLAALGLLAAATAATAQPVCVEWQDRITLDAPSDRAGHVMAYDAARNRTVLFGGVAVPASAETLLWDGAAWTLAADASSPHPVGRSGHAMVYDSAREVCVLFGTTGGEGATGETWEWDGTAWAQAAGGPSARGQHMMAFDSARGRTVMFGGHDGDFVFSPETWEYNGTSWTLVTSDGPSARIGAAMTFDSARGVTVMFGGFSELGGESAETWEWNGVAWLLRSPGGGAGEPPAMAHQEMVYHASLGKSVLFGGSLPGTPGGRLWAWDGTQWTQLDPVETDTLGSRFQYGMSYDSARATVTLFGGSVVQGEESQLENDTHELVSSVPLITSQSDSQTVPPGGAVSFFVVADSQETLNYQWRRNQVDLENDGRITGANTFNLVISQVTTADAGSYDVIVSNGCGTVMSVPVQLIVPCPADFNNSGSVTSADITAFLSAWFSDLTNGTLLADMNNDNMVTSADITTFLAVWFGAIGGGGC